MNATIRPLGPDGWLVSFADGFDDAANRAALAFRAAVEAEAWPVVRETAASLVSVFVRFDPLGDGADRLEAELRALAEDRDWAAAGARKGRRLWRVPVVWGGDLAPGFADAARAAGLPEDDLRAGLAGARLRVLMLGFAPGQPYLGTLPDAFDVPRTTDLTPEVPEGALVLAVRQLTLYVRPGPTGWRHVGQTAFRAFRPGGDPVFPLTAGDEMCFRAVSADELSDIRASDRAGDGGAEIEDVP